MPQNLTRWGHWSPGQNRFAPFTWMEHGSPWTYFSSMLWGAIRCFLSINVAMIDTYVLNILLMCVNISTLHKNSMRELSYYLRPTDEAHVGKVTCCSHTAGKLLRYHLIPGSLVPELECLAVPCPACIHSNHHIPLCVPAGPINCQEILPNGLQKDYPDIFSSE